MNLHKILALSFVSLILAACGGSPSVISDKPDPAAALEATATPGFVIEKTNDLAIDAMRAVVEETYPVQVAVIVNGRLPDSCTSIVRIKADYKNSEYLLTVVTRREVGLECEAVEQDFEKYVFLDVEDLPAGTYNVSLNGLSDSFTLDEDYEVPEGKSG